VKDSSKTTLCLPRTTGQVEGRYIVYNSFTITDHSNRSFLIPLYFYLSFQQSTSDPIVVAPKSTSALARTVTISRSMEQLSSRLWDLEAARSSSSSVRTSNTSSSSPYSSTSSTLTHVEDTDITGAGKDIRPKDVVPFSQSPIRPVVDVKVLPTRDNLNPEELLDHLLTGAKHVVDVGGLVESARTSFSLIEHWYKANSR